MVSLVAGLKMEGIVTWGSGVNRRDHSTEELNKD